MKNSAFSPRFLLSDALWKTIEPIIRQGKSAGKRIPPKISDRLFVEAILHQARTGNPWRDIPAQFGYWNSAYKRFRRWERLGIWRRIWQQLQTRNNLPLRRLFIDSTILKAHQHASGALKRSGGQQSQAIGRSRGGLTTKLHAACADERTAVSLSLSAGQSHDAKNFESVWRGVPQSRWLESAVMDRAYDSVAIRRFLANQGVEAVIPPRRNRRGWIHCDRKKYKMREKVERFFCKLKEFRRIATRYDKLACTFMAFIHLAAAIISAKGIANP